MSWNPVLNKFIEIKEAASATGNDLWDYDAASLTCVEYWVSITGREEYSDLLRQLVLNEYQDFLQIRRRALY